MSQAASVQLTRSQSRKVRVLHLRASNFVGGPERQILRYLSVSEYESVIGTFVGETEGRDLVSEASALGATVLQLPDANLAALVQLSRYLRREPVNLLCTHGYKADMIGVLAGHFTGTPTAAFLRGWTGESNRVRCYEHLDRTVFLPFASRVVCLSRVQADHANTLTSPHKVRIVSNAVESCECSRKLARAELSRRFGVPAGAQLVASSGRLSPEKGTARFVEAARGIHARLPNAYFVVFGEGPMRAVLEKLSGQLGLRDSLQFVGFVKDFTALLPGIDVIVNPSLTEVMPNVVMEAMAARVPIVATDVGALREISGGAGMEIVPAASSEAISDAVVRILTDSQHAEALVNASWNRIRRDYNLSVQECQLRSLYGEFVQKS